MAGKSIYRRAMEELDKQRLLAEERKKRALKRFKKAPRNRPRSMPPNTSSKEIYIDGATRHARHRASRKRYFD